MIVYVIDIQLNVYKINICHKKNDLINTYLN